MCWFFFKFYYYFWNHSLKISLNSKIEIKKNKKTKIYFLCILNPYTIHIHYTLTRTLHAYAYTTHLRIHYICAYTTYAHTLHTHTHTNIHIQLHVPVTQYTNPVIYNIDIVCRHFLKIYYYFWNHSLKISLNSKIK